MVIFHRKSGYTIAEETTGERLTLCAGALLHSQAFEPLQTGRYSVVQRCFKTKVSSRVEQKLPNSLYDHCTISIFSLGKSCTSFITDISSVEDYVLYM